jgi:hypothetical protein
MLPHVRDNQPKLSFADVYIHEEEACPLHANLRDAQQRSRTWKAANLSATRHVLPAFRQRYDVRDTRGAGHGAQEHEHGAQPAGGASCDDLIVLREVRHEDADNKLSVWAVS